MPTAFSRHVLARLTALLLLAAALPTAAAFAGGIPRSSVLAPASTPVPPREVLRKTAEPIVDLFSRDPAGPNRAFSMHLRITEATNQPAELRGAALAFRAVAAPENKVLFQFPALGTIVTICRQNQTVWASPGSLLAPILQRAQAAKVSRSDQEPIAPLRLAIPTKLFWLLFHFVGVRDVGSDPLGTVACRQLELEPPGGGGSGKKGEENKHLRLWIRTDSYQIARLDWKSTPADRNTLVVEDAKLAATLPASDFQPDDAQRADLLDIPVARFRPFMKLLGEDEEKREKDQRAQPSSVATNH